MLNPVALSIIANAFQQQKDRARAAGIWETVGGATSVTALVIFLIFMNRAAKSLWWTCVSFEAYLSAAQQFWPDFASFAGFLFLNALFLQQVHGFSAYYTGLRTLPLAIMVMLCAPLSGRLVGSRGTDPLFET